MSKYKIDEIKDLCNTTNFPKYNADITVFFPQKKNTEKNTSMQASKHHLLVLWNCINKSHQITSVFWALKYFAQSAQGPWFHWLGTFELLDVIQRQCASYAIISKGINVLCDNEEG